MPCLQGTSLTFKAGAFSEASATLDDRNKVRQQQDVAAACV